jgi:outer membrane protein TolC
VANRSLFIAQRMVEEGLGTNRDVLDAQDEIRRSESQLATSKINYYLSLVRLRVAVGQDVTPLSAQTQRTPQDGEVTPEPGTPAAPPAQQQPAGGG